MTHPEIITLRRNVLRAAILTHGGAYITPEDNNQPGFMPRIASIHLRGITATGSTEAEAQADFFRQMAAREWKGAQQ
ncbi:MAG: hypothetical protein AAFR10_16795 [Pseudomonadota bacterium]